jgi:hypothetical protein
MKSPSREGVAPLRLPGSRAAAGRGEKAMLLSPLPTRQGTCSGARVEDLGLCSSTQSGPACSTWSKLSILMKSNLSIFFFCCLYFLPSHIRKYRLIQGYKYLLLCTLENFIVLAFTFKVYDPF